MNKPLTPIEYQWVNRVDHGLRLFEFYSKAFTAIQCFGDMALVLSDGGPAVCNTSSPTPSTFHFDRDDPRLMPEQYQKAQKRLNGLAFDYKLLPKALKPRMEEDPQALMTLIGLPSRARWTATKKLGRMLAKENAMDSQNFFSKPSKLTVLSASRSKRAAKDNKIIQKWWKKAHSKSTKKGKISSFELDDEEGVGRIVGYIVRQAVGDLLDFLDDDPYYGLAPDEDDIPKNLLSKTTKWKKYPAIFKGDAPVCIQEADFYAARKILHPSKDDED